MSQSDSRPAVDSTFRVSVSKAYALPDRLGRPQPQPWIVCVTWDSIIMLDAWADGPQHASDLISTAVRGAADRIARGLE